VNRAEVFAGGGRSETAATLSRCGCLGFLGGIVEEIRQKLRIFIDV